MYTNIYLLLFIACYYMVIFIVPAIRLKKETGIKAYVFDTKQDTAHSFLGKMMGPISAMLFVLLTVNAFFNDALIYFAPFKWLELTELKWIGFILIHSSFIWIIIAQIQMSNSWRVGIDKNASTELKTKGLFSISRNPVFLDMIISLCGIFLILPNAISLLAAVSTILLFQVQVRLEEDYLLSKHGDSYLNYCQKTPRWLF